MSLISDAKNILNKDPAARSLVEVMLLYPGFRILVNHRMAKWCYRHRQFFLARYISQRGRKKTGNRNRDSSRGDDRQQPVH